MSQTLCPVSTDKYHSITTAKHTASVNRCAKCGDAGHDQPDCQQIELCVNCNGDRAAASCPQWKLEKSPANSVDKNIAFKQARKLAIALIAQAPSERTMTVGQHLKPRQFVPPRPPVRTWEFIIIIIFIFRYKHKTKITKIAIQWRAARETLQLTDWLPK